MPLSHLKEFPHQSQHIVIYISGHGFLKIPSAKNADNCVFCNDVSQAYEFCFLEQSNDEIGYFELNNTLKKLIFWFGFGRVHAFNK